MKTKTHYKGRYLSLVERDDWEFATRTNPVVAVLVAWLPDHRLVLVEQYRKPMSVNQGGFVYGKYDTAAAAWLAITIAARVAAQRARRRDDRGGRPDGGQNGRGIGRSSE